MRLEHYESSTRQSITRQIFPNTIFTHYFNFKSIDHWNPFALFGESVVYIDGGLAFVFEITCSYHKALSTMNFYLGFFFNYFDH
jgi:hypothetical protein